MKGKHVRFTLPDTIRIKDYSLGFRTEIPYNPDLQLKTLRRFRDFQYSDKCRPNVPCHIIHEDNKSYNLRIDIPISRQNVKPGDTIRIIPI